MTVYVVLAGDLLGHVRLQGVYEDETDALRAANEHVLRRMVPAEVIPAGMSVVPDRHEA